MGYDERQQSTSSGVLVAVVVVVLLIAVLGILAVVGVGFFFVRTSRVEVQRAIAAKKRAVAEAHRAEAEALRAVEEAQPEARPDPIINFEVNLDSEGICQSSYFTQHLMTPRHWLGVPRAAIQNSAQQSILIIA